MDIEDVRRHGREIRQRLRLSERPPRRQKGCGARPQKVASAATLSQSPEEIEEMVIGEVQREGRQIRKQMHSYALRQRASGMRSVTPLARGAPASQLQEQPHEMALATDACAVLPTKLPPPCGSARSSAELSTAVPSQASSPQASERSSHAVTPRPTSGRLLRLGTPRGASASSSSTRVAAIASPPPLSQRSLIMHTLTPVLRQSSGHGCSSNHAGNSSPSSPQLGGGSPPPARANGPGAEAPSPQPESLEEAARLGDAAVARECLLKGVPPNARDEHGWAPLHYSAADGHLEVCRLLLEFRGDANAQLADLSTPLMLAADEGHLQVALLLLENGAGARRKDEAGFTALERCSPATRAEFADYVQERTCWAPTVHAGVRV